jgi:type I restriction enzyme S subunit
VWAPYNSEGTVFGAINAADLQAVRIPWPSDNDLSRCERDLEEIDNRLTVALRENIALTELRDSLLPELLSGRLRVRDAEKVVEEVV